MVTRTGSLEAPVDENAAMGAAETARAAATAGRAVATERRAAAEAMESERASITCNGSFWRSAEVHAVRAHWGHPDGLV